MALVDALKYSPDQPRDDHGRWGGEGESGETFFHGTSRSSTVDPV